MFRTFFQEELEYLRELGRAVAREHSALDSFLSAPEGDAALERVLEGTAFLTAGLRRKLDDDIPELTHPVLRALAAPLLRPGPALSVLGFEPVGQMVTEPHRVPAGTEIDSNPVDGVACRFRSAWDVTLLPLRLADAKVEGDVGATPTLVLRLELTAGANPENLLVDTLRLYLCGEPARRSALYFYLSESVSEVTLRAPGRRGSARQLPADSVRPAGFDPGDRLWPDAPGLPAAYQRLQEFFAFREKFHFVDVRGIGSLEGVGDGRALELAVRFRRPRVPELAAGPEDVRLYCTPIVNLFTRKSEPMALGSGLREYRIEPADAAKGRAEVYAVERIEGWTRGTARSVEVAPFDAVRQDGEGTVFFRTRTEASVIERRVDTWVSFVDARQEHVDPDVDTAVAELLCTNGDLPAQLAAGDICRATPSSPPVARFRNVAPVTPGVAPPIDAGLPWRLLAQLSPSRHVLADPEALRWAIASFDLRGLRDRQAARATQRLLDGVLALRPRVEDVFQGGLPARGLRLEVDLDASCFDGPGEMALFARLLEEILPLYATENAMLRLVVNVVPQGERWERPIRRGAQPAL